MSYRCESCGTDAPLSEPCPVCEPLVTRALDGDYDLKPIYMPLPCGETRALLARIEAMRVDRAALVEQLAQRSREIQALQMALRNVVVECKNHNTDPDYNTESLQLMQWEQLCAT